MRTKKTSPAAVDKLAAKIGKLKPEARRTVLKLYWDIGALLARQYGRRYGENQLGMLAAELGWCRSMLHCSLRFHELWPTPEDLARVTRRGLSFSHIRALLHKNLTAREREAFERYVEKERPNVRELWTKVRRLVGKR